MREVGNVGIALVMLNLSYIGKVAKTLKPWICAYDRFCMLLNDVERSKQTDRRVVKVLVKGTRLL
jgi:hypothetical protein